MNAGINLTSHVANPENIIIINAQLTDPAWLVTNGLYLATNTLPNPTIPNYYVVDLNLVSSTSGSVLVEWLLTNVTRISYPDSYAFVALGHELQNTTYRTQIDEAIAKSDAYRISGADLVALSEEFDNLNYPHYFEIVTNTSGQPEGIRCCDQINSAGYFYSFTLFKALFKALDVAVGDRKDVTFSFARLFNSTTDVEGVGFQMEFGTQTRYYDFSGGSFPPIELSKTIASRVK